MLSLTDCIICWLLFFGNVASSVTKNPGKLSKDSISKFECLSKTVPNQYGVGLAKKVTPIITSSLRSDEAPTSLSQSSSSSSSSSSSIYRPPSKLSFSYLIPSTPSSPSSRLATPFQVSSHVINPVTGQPSVLGSTSFVENLKAVAAGTDRVNTNYFSKRAPTTTSTSQPSSPILKSDFEHNSGASKLDTVVKEDEKERSRRTGLTTIHTQGSKSPSTRKESSLTTGHGVRSTNITHKNSVHLVSIMTLKNGSQTKSEYYNTGFDSSDVVSSDKSPIPYQDKISSRDSDTDSVISYGSDSGSRKRQNPSVSVYSERKMKEEEKAPAETIIFTREILKLESRNVMITFTGGVEKVPLQYFFEPIEGDKILSPKRGISDIVKPYECEENLFGNVTTGILSPDKSVMCNRIFEKIHLLLNIPYGLVFIFTPNYGEGPIYASYRYYITFNQHAFLIVQFVKVKELMMDLHYDLIFSLNDISEDYTWFTRHLKKQDKVCLITKYPLFVNEKFEKFSSYEGLSSSKYQEINKVASFCFENTTHQEQMSFEIPSEKHEYVSKDNLQDDVKINRSYFLVYLEQGRSNLKLFLIDQVSKNYMKAPLCGRYLKYLHDRSFIKPYEEVFEFVNGGCTFVVCSCSELEKFDKILKDCRFKSGTYIIGSSELIKKQKKKIMMKKQKDAQS